MNKIIFGTTKEDDCTISGVESDPKTNTNYLGSMMKNTRIVLNLMDLYMGLL